MKSTVLASLLDRDDFVVSGTDKRGMVTAGGISLKEIDLKTMRMGAALYAVGEAIDADGITGGYNLQLCWSTASAAAEDISAKEKL